MTNPIHSADAAEQVQWRNIQKVVRELAAFCFGGPTQDGSIQLSSAYVAIVNSLTAKDGANLKLEPLPRAAAQVGANGVAPINDALLLLGKAVIDLRNNCTDEFLVRRVTQWVEGGMKALRGIAAGAPASRMDLMDTTSHEEGRHTICTTLPRKHGCIPNPNFLVDDDPSDLDTLHFNAQRLRNVANLVGLQSAIPEDDAALDGARGAVLGQIAGKLRATGAPAETPKPANLVRACNAEFPISDSPHASVLTRNEADREAFGKGWLACTRANIATPAATIGAGEGKDAARLDFLETAHVCSWFQLGRKIITDTRTGQVHSGVTWREAIDAALRSKTSPGEAG